MTESTRFGTLTWKRAKLHPAVRWVLHGFPRQARQEIGRAILRLQRGDILSFPLTKPMKQVGMGVEEIRVRDASGIFRVFFLARLKDQILVFHAFQKKTKKTPKREIETGIRRLREMLNEQN